MALPDWASESDQWVLIGPDDALTPEWLARLLDTRGTAAEWEAIGLPIRFDPLGNPESYRIWGRFWSITFVSDDEAEDFPACTSRGVRAPTPLPAEEPEDLE